MKNLRAVLFLLLTPNIFSVTYWHLYFFHELLYYFLIKNGRMIIGTVLLHIASKSSHSNNINLRFVRNIFPSLIFLPCGLLNNSFKCLRHQTDLFYLSFLNCLDRTPWLQYSVRPLSFIFSDTLMVLLFSNSVSIPSGIETSAWVWKFSSPQPPIPTANWFIHSTNMHSMSKTDPCPHHVLLGRTTIKKRF